MGYASPRRMLREMDAAEWAEWQEFYALETFGPLQDDLRAGVVACAAGANLFREKGKPPLTPGDLFPGLKRSEPRQSPEQMELVMRAWAAATGGTITEADGTVHDYGHDHRHPGAEVHG